MSQEATVENVSVAQGHGSYPPPAAAPRQRYVALAGNPNCGKTTLFNALTGLRAKVGKRK